MGQSADFNANADNIDNIQVTLSADTTKPVLDNIEVIYPKGQSEAKKDQKVTVRADAYDADSEIDNVEINAENLDGGVKKMTYVSGNTYEENIKVTTDNTGDLQITLTANDTATNSKVKTASVTVATEVTSYDVSLVEGWNLISLPLIPDNEQIENVLDNAYLSGATVDNIESVWYYDTSQPDNWRRYVPGPVSDDLLTMEDGKAYYVKMETSATLTVHGQEVTGTPPTSPTYSLDAGWNMVGFKSTAKMTREAYLDNSISTEGRILKVKKYNTSTEQFNDVAKSDDMVPGVGYWVFMTEPGTLVT